MKIGIMGAVTVLVGALAACSDNGEPAAHRPFDTVRYASNGVTFDYPTSWENKEPTFDTTDTLWQFMVGPPGPANGYVEILAFQADHVLYAAEVSQVADGFFQIIQSDVMGDRPEGDVEQTTVAGVPGLQMRWSRPDGAAKRAVVFADGDLLYTIDCYISTKDATHHVEEACAAVVGSFAFSD